MVYYRGKCKREETCQENINRWIAGARAHGYTGTFAELLRLFRLYGEIYDREHGLESAA